MEEHTYYFSHSTFRWLATDAGAMIADDYIEKPIDINELKTRIDNVLNKVKK